MKNLRQYSSEPALSTAKTIQPHASKLYSTKSEPVISRRKIHPLLDDSDDHLPHSYNDLLVAAETLENIVMEGTLMGGNVRNRLSVLGRQVSKTSSQMNNRVLKLVYGAMKFMATIDVILIKTKFLVYNTQFLNHLGLLKIMIYDLMKFHFENERYVGISYKIINNQDQEYQNSRCELVHDLSESLLDFNVKFAAAFARIRIEKQASGNDFKEQLLNILPQDVRRKEDIAVEMNKTFRVEKSKISFAELQAELSKLGIMFQNDQNILDLENVGDFVYLDKDFDDLLVIPASLFTVINTSSLAASGKLVFQDKSSLCVPEYLRQLKVQNIHAIETRAGCGVKTVELSKVVGANGKVFSFENRSGRITSLKEHLKSSHCDNVEIVEESFLTVNPKEDIFKNVTCVFVEPPNSGTAILDKLGYLLQEEEFPNDSYTIKDLLILKKQQYKLLRRAFEFPNVNTVIYMTRSIHREENEQVIEEVRDYIGKDWKLQCVLPQMASDRHYDYEIEECLKVRPSEDFGNGIFLAAFVKVDSIVDLKFKPTEISIEQQVPETPFKRNRKSKPRKEAYAIKRLPLAKHQRDLAYRLSGIPPPQKTKSRKNLNFDSAAQVVITLNDLVPSKETDDEFSEMGITQLRKMDINLKNNDIKIIKPWI